MKNQYKLFLPIILCLILLSGCSSDNAPLAEETSSEHSTEQSNTNDENSLGEFTMQDIEGNSYTQEMFSNYDLTMINVFTTWCTPCINEIPDLEILRQEVSDKNVNVIGIVLDAADVSGQIEEVVDQAKELAQMTGAAYPFLIPDSTFLNGRLLGIQAVPETFFVDKDGNIVGETYSGSRSLEDWKAVVETTIANQSGDAS